MEDTVFPSEAVAKLMKAHVIEARLHTDAQNTLTVEQLAENRDYQDRIGGSKANPYFVIVDPSTGDIIKEFELSGGFGSWKAKWIKFIQNSAKQAGRPLD